MSDVIAKQFNKKIVLDVNPTNSNPAVITLQIDAGDSETINLSSGGGGGGGLDQLTGDVTAGPGTGSQAATVISVGGSSAGNIHSAEVKVTGSGVSQTELSYIVGVTSGIQAQLNSKQSTITTGNLTDVGTDGITITGGTGAIIGSGTSLSQHVADSTHNGYLSSADWVTFSGKQSSGNYITALTGDVTASGPGSAAATLATVSVNKGGTGLTTLTANNVILGNGTSTPNFVAPGTSGNVLTSNGTTWTSAAATSGATITSWTSYTPTFTNMGTVAGISFYWRQVGPDSIDILGKFTAGTGTGSIAHVSIPSGLTVDSTPVPDERNVGMLRTVDATGGLNFITAAGGNTTFEFWSDSAIRNLHGNEMSAVTWTVQVSGLPVTGL